MSGNVHPNPGPIFPCSVCAGNVTWWGKSMQCCTCSKWVHLRCSQLPLSKFRSLASSHSWSCPPFCVPTHNTVTPLWPLLHFSFYLKLSSRSGRNSFLSLLILSGYSGPLDTRFSRGTTQLMSWSDREHYLCPLLSLVVSILLSLVSTLFIS